MVTLPERSSGHRARVSAALVCALGVLTAILLDAPPDRAGAQGTPAPPPQALEILASMNAQIDRALQENQNSGDPHFYIENASEDKHDFLALVFGERCYRLFVEMASYDGYLAVARARQSGPTRERLFEKAAEAAQDVRKLLRRCGSSRSKIADEMAGAADGLFQLERKGKLSDRDQKHAADLARQRKRNIFRGGSIYGCNLIEVYLLIDDIDVALDLAFDDSANRAAKTKHLTEARRKGQRLADLWSRAPCGQSPPPDGQSAIENQLASNHPNGFGNPPSFECNRAKVTPTQAGVQVTDQITRPDNTTVTKQATTNSSGVATFSSEISQTGDYTHITTATVNGQTVSDTDVNTVTAEDNGTCPPATP